MLEMLETLFLEELPAEDKKHKLDDEFGIAMTGEDSKEDGTMCNYGEWVMNRGIEKGAQLKCIEIVKNMLALNMSIEEIMKVTGATKEEVEEIAAIEN